jgi:hypothetical protein
MAASINTGVTFPLWYSGLAVSVSHKDGRPPETGEAQAEFCINEAGEITLTSPMKSVCGQENVVSNVVLSRKGGQMSVEL